MSLSILLTLIISIIGNYKTLFKNFMKMVIAGIITLVVCLAIALFMDTLQMQKQLLEITKICTIGLVCIIIYVGLNLLFRNVYVLELKNRLVKAKK